MLQENMCGQMLVVFSHAFFNQMNYLCQRKPSGFPMDRLRVPTCGGIQWPFYCSWMWPGLFADSNSSTWASSEFPCLSGYKGHEMILQVLLDWRSLRFQCLGCPNFSILIKSALKCYQESSWYEISIMVLKLLRKICSAFSPVRNRANLLKNIIHSDSHVECQPLEAIFRWMQRSPFIKSERHAPGAPLAIDPIIPHSVHFLLLLNLSTIKKFVGRVPKVIEFHNCEEL